MKNEIKAVAVEKMTIRDRGLAVCRTTGLWLWAVWRAFRGRPPVAPLRLAPSLTTAEWMPLAERKQSSPETRMGPALAEGVTLQMDTLSPFFTETVVEFPPTVPMDLLDDAVHRRRVVNG